MALNVPGPPISVSLNLAPPEPEPPESLAHLAQSVLGLYRDLVLKSSGHNDESQKILDQFGRLRVWVEQTGAALDTAGSLQDTLQNDATLQSSVADVLQQLKMLLSTVISMSKGPEPGLLASEEDAGSMLTSDSEYSVDSAQSEIHQAPKVRPRISRFSLVLSHIGDQIGLLYHYSSIFRRPRLRGRYLHSKSQNADAEIPYYEYSHVQQKLLEWAERAHLGFDLEALCMRIATANTRRREQLRFWARHPYAEKEEEDESDAPGREPVVRKTTGGPAPSEGTSYRSRPTTVKTFSSVARSAIYETETQAGPSRTVYAASEVGDGVSSRVPKLPAAATQAPTFECPFCQTQLDSASVADRTAWKRHVFRDLRPYVCTFAQCSNPDKMYATRREWIYHEMQMHRRQWDCRLCRISCESKDLMTAHIQLNHAGQWAEHQLSAVLEACEAPANGTQQHSCAFCEHQLPLTRLMDHVAGHMEQLALFVLPAGNDDVPDEPSSAALSSLDSRLDDDVDAVQPEKRSTLGDPFALSTSLEGPSQGDGNEEKRTEEWVCDDCGRVFDQYHKLNHHRRYHDRPYACAHPGCNARFGTATHLERHINDKHLKARRFYCTQPDCPYSRKGGKSFPRKDNWRRHMINAHGIRDAIEVTDDVDVSET